MERVFSALPPVEDTALFLLPIISQIILLSRKIDKHYVLAVYVIKNHGLIRLFAGYRYLVMATPISSPQTPPARRWSGRCGRGCSPGIRGGGWLFGFSTVLSWFYIPLECCLSFYLAVRLLTSSKFSATYCSTAENRTS